jgi:hypothetical protein
MGTTAGWRKSQAKLRANNKSGPGTPVASSESGNILIVMTAMQSAKNNAR